MGAGMVVGQKASAFGPSARRLVRRMAPYRIRTLAVIALTVVSVLATALGPRVLGRATDLIFSGLIGGRLPDGLTKDQAVELLRQRGDDKVADMVSGMDVVPGQGVDFDAPWGRCCSLVLAIYVGAAALAWLAGWILNDVVQGTVRRMRSDVEDKVHRLPLAYFDRQPRGELLSRVSNDIDNVSTDPPADPEPAAHLAADRGRGAGDDVLDLAGARARGAGLGAGLDARHGLR